MIELIIKDADEIINYLRNRLNILNIKLEGIIAANNKYINKDDKEINTFIDFAVPLDEREDFERFIQTNMEELRNEINKLENYIYLLTAGSEK